MSVTEYACMLLNMLVCYEYVCLLLNECLVLNMSVIDYVSAAECDTVTEFMYVTQYV